MPTKSQRDMSHLILSSLRIDDTKILSTENIKQLKKDLSFLKPQNGKTTKEYMIELGIFDVNSQKIEKVEFENLIIQIKESRT